MTGGTAGDLPAVPHFVFGRGRTMTDAFKDAGLTLLAIFAICALGASAAQAAPEFESSASSGTITGQDLGNGEFITEGGTVVCSEGHFEGTYSQQKSASLTLHPTWS